MQHSSWAALARRTRLPRDTPGTDLLVYLAFAAFALITAFVPEYYGHRVWGAFAATGYLLAATHSTWLLVRARRGLPRGGRWWHSRWVGILLTVVGALLAPLIYLILRRISSAERPVDPGTWAAQPEVWVVERAARLLLDTGTPYLDIATLDRLPGPYDYTPYGPVMALFGLPKALADESTAPALAAGTDVRVVFVFIAAACLLASWLILSRPRIPVPAAQLALAAPPTTLTAAVAGPDLAVLGLLILAIALAARLRAAAAGVILALAIATKLTAVPAVLVLAVLLARGGTAALARYTTALLATIAAVSVPIWLRAPEAFIEHVVRFPTGTAAAESPATSPLPGHLLASTGPVGHAAALLLLATAAVLVAAWVLASPPRTAGDAAWRLAVGLGVAMVLAPATRWGYLIYPLVLTGVRLALPERSEDERAPTTPVTTASPPLSSSRAPRSPGRFRER
ncbi:glycosyltransferase 87 family protein [Haloechinothrix sp. LS1_15]|uniref:glycosyltransferase 87 family protein n=1 Tax=Haloechinothrix sp. LS1_15 TaxID=2652248 RepID=UPI0029442C35|nr:glycosyltransferase 87 family protein [Haloechinothrix sp. LS1_15]MDV6013202.1 DUF2029 domain-containing protein [Haloechinothrix sp. LS1_15]